MYRAGCEQSPRLWSISGQIQATRPAGIKADDTPVQEVVGQDLQMGVVEDREGGGRQTCKRKGTGWEQEGQGIEGDDFPQLQHPLMPQKSGRSNGGSPGGCNGHMRGKHE